MDAVEYLKEQIQDKQEQIGYNNREIENERDVAFYKRWNKGLMIEIEAFENAVQALIIEAA